MKTDHIMLMAGCALLGPGFIVAGCLFARPRTWVKVAAKVETAKIAWEGDGHVIYIQYSFFAVDPASKPPTQKKYVSSDLAPGRMPWTKRGRQARLETIQGAPAIEAWYARDNPLESSLKVRSKATSLMQGTGFIFVGIAILLFGLVGYLYS